MTVEVDLADLADAIGGRVEDIARNFIIELFSAVIMRSPVDTGRFRANWNVSYGSPNYTTTDSTDANRSSGQVESLRGARVVGMWWLTNALPYAAVLEYGLYPNPPKGGEGKTAGGYSIQAPGGMIRLAVAEFRSHLDAAAENARSWRVS